MDHSDCPAARHFPDAVNHFSSRTQRLVCFIPLPAAFYLNPFRLCGTMMGWRTQRSIFSQLNCALRTGALWKPRVAQNEALWCVRF